MEIVKGDTIKVYGIMNDFGSYKQFIGRVDIIRNGRTYTLESYKEPYIEKKDGNGILMVKNISLSDYETEK